MEAQNSVHHLDGEEGIGALSTSSGRQQVSSVENGRAKFTGHARGGARLCLRAGFQIMQASVVTLKFLYTFRSP
jgi:hypothetical protein